MLLVRTDASRSDENYIRFRSPIGKLFLDVCGTKIAKGECKDKRKRSFRFCHCRAVAYLLSLKIGKPGHKPHNPLFLIFITFVRPNPKTKQQMETYRKIAAANLRRAAEIVAETKLVASWEAIGAEVHIIGSLATGLMMKNRDIDLHVYTDTVSVADSFRAAARIASHPGIVRMEYNNLIDTEEACIEWHAAFRDTDGRMWKMDMIHIRRGSAYDGFAERMASRIGAVLTEETRDAILRLKYETPDTESVIGAEYYAAVLSGGVRDWAGFLAWREAHRGESLIGWLP